MSIGVVNKNRWPPISHHAYVMIHLLYRNEKFNLTGSTKKKAAWRYILTKRGTIVDSTHQHRCGDGHRSVRVRRRLLVVSSQLLFLESAVGLVGLSASVSAVGFSLGSQHLFLAAVVGLALICFEASVVGFS